MKTIILFIAVMFLAVRLYSFPSANNHPYHGSEQLLTASIEIGLIYGLINEYVYNGDKTLSRLDWEMKPLYFSGFTISTQMDTFWAAAGYWRGLNTDLGFIEDSDWEDLDGVKTRYSKHDNKLQSADFTDIKIGKILSYDDSFFLSAHIGFSYAVIKMAAVDGYRKYAPSYIPVASYGTGIIYEQVYYIPFIGIDASRAVTDSVDLSASLSVSPLLFCSASDRHIFRNLDFYDSINAAPWLSLNMILHYRFLERYRIYLSAGYTIVPESSGDSYYIDTVTGVKSRVYEDSAGIRYESLLLKTGIAARIF